MRKKRKWLKALKIFVQNVRVTTMTHCHIDEGANALGEASAFDLVILKTIFTTKVVACSMRHWLTVRRVPLNINNIKV